MTNEMKKAALALGLMLLVLGTGIGIAGLLV